MPSDDLLPSLMGVSDVLGTGWFASDAAAVGPGKTVAVVGDGYQMTGTTAAYCNERGMGERICESGIDHAC